MATAYDTNLILLSPAIYAAFQNAFFYIFVKYDGTEKTINFSSMQLCQIIDESYVRKHAKICSGVNFSSFPL